MEVRRRGRGGVQPPLSLVLLLLLPLLSSPSFLRASLKNHRRLSPKTNEPVSQDAEVRSFVYALLSFFFSFLFFFSLSLGSHSPLLPPPQKEKTRKKKKKPNYNSHVSLFDLLARSRAAESRRGGPEGLCSGSAVSVGESGGAVGAKRRDGAIEFTDKKKANYRSLVALRPPQKKKKKLHLWSSSTVGMSTLNNDIAPPSPLEPLSRAV